MPLTVHCGRSVVRLSSLLTFQSFDCELAAALGHVIGFPDLGLLRRLRPAPMPSTDDEPSRRRPGWPVGREHRHGSHVHHRFPRQGRRPAMPQRPSTSTPQTFLVTTRPDHTCTPPGRPDAGRNPRQSSPQPSPHPPGSSWWFRLRGFITLVPHVRLSVSLARPRPSGSTDLSRRCQGCFPPSPASPGSGCPQLQPACCDSPAVKVSHPHSNPQRLVAHLIDEPAITSRMPGRAGGVDELWRERLHPPVDRHVIDGYRVRPATPRRRGRTARSADTSAPTPRSPPRKPIAGRRRRARRPTGHRISVRHPETSPNATEPPKPLRPRCAGSSAWSDPRHSYKQPVTRLATLDSRHAARSCRTARPAVTNPRTSVWPRVATDMLTPQAPTKQRRAFRTMPASFLPSHLTGGHSISAVGRTSYLVGETAPAPALRSWRGTSTGCSRPWSCSGSSDSATRSDFRVTSGPVWATRPAHNVLLSSNGRAPPAWFPFGLDGIGAYRRARAMPGPGSTQCASAVPNTGSCEGPCESPFRGGQPCRSSLPDSSR